MTVGACQKIPHRADGRAMKRREREKSESKSALLTSLLPRASPSPGERLGVRGYRGRPLLHRLHRRARWPELRSHGECPGHRRRHLRPRVRGARRPPGAGRPVDGRAVRQALAAGRRRLRGARGGLRGRAAAPRRGLPQAGGGETAASTAYPPTSGASSPSRRCGGTTRARGSGASAATRQWGA